jgi:hypothetical protein
MAGFHFLIHGAPRCGCGRYPQPTPPNFITKPIQSFILRVRIE